MSTQRAFKAVPAPAQVAQRDTDAMSLLRDLLTTDEAAARLKFRGTNAVKSFLKWADRHRVPRLHRGRVCLWQPAVLVAFLERKTWTRDRHVPTVKRGNKPHKMQTLAGQVDCPRGDER